MKRLSEIPPKRWVKTALRLLLYTTLMLAVVVVSGFLFLQTHYAQDKLKSFIEKAAETSFHAKLNIGKISGDLFSHLSADQVTLSGKAGIVLQAERISIHYLSLLLLKKIVLITDLRLDGAILNLIQEADGSWNLADLIPPEEKKKPSDAKQPAFSLILKHVTVDNARVVLTKKDNEGETIRRFDNIRLSAGLSNGPAITAHIFDMAFDLDNPRFLLSRLNGKIAYDPKRHRIQCDTLSIRTDASELVLDTTVDLKGESPEIDATAVFKGISLPEFGQWIGVDLPVREKLTWSIHAKGTPEAIFHELTLHAGRLSIQSRGEVAISEAGELGIDISGRVQGLDPAELQGYAPDWMTGDIHAQIHAKGINLNRPDRQGSLDITLNESTIAGHSITDGRFNLKAHHNDLNIQNGLLITPSGTMEMEAGLIGILDDAGLKKATVRMRLTDFDLAGITRKDEIQGRINLELSADASFSSPSASGFERMGVSAQINSKINASRILGIPIHKGHLNARWADNNLVITQADLSAEPGEIALNGSADFKNRTCQINAHTILPDLQQLSLSVSRWFPQISETVQLAGAIKLSAEMRGWWDDPLISASLDGKKIQANHLSAESCSIEGTWQGLPERFVSASQWRIQGLKVSEHLFKRIETHMDISPERILVEGTGVFENEETLMLRGQVDSWLASEKSITVDTLRLSAKQGELVNNGPIRATVSSNTLDIESLYLESDQAVFSLMGRIAPAGNHSIKLSLTNMDMDQVTWVFPWGKRIKGIVSGDMDISGTSENPVVSATLSARNGSLFDFSFSKLNLALQYAQSEAVVKASVYKTDKKILDANARFFSSLSFMPFSFKPAAGGMDVTVETEDLKLSDFSVPTIKSLGYDGTVKLVGRVTGTFDSPIIDGTLVLKSGRLELPEHQLSYEEVTAAIRFSKNRIIVDKISIKGDQEGSLQGTGTLTLSGLLPKTLDFRLSGENVYIPYKRAIRARVHPDLTLSGNLSAPKLTGTLTIIESRVNMDRLTDQGPAEIQVINTRPDEAGRIDLGEEKIEGPSFMKPLAADVIVNIPNRAWLKGQGFDMEIGGQINLKKDSGQPFTLMGSLNTIRGTYTFRGKRFKVNRGIVTFMGLAEPDPILDIEGIYAVKGVNIIARLTGTARQINLALESNPQMDQADILSYLIFGRPTDSLKGQQSMNTETAALRLTGQLTSTQLSAIVEDILHIDTFSVDVEGEDIGSGSVSIGKYVHPNVFLNYRQGLKVDEIYQLSVTYEINENFSLEALIGDEKSTGVDLIWTHDF